MLTIRCYNGLGALVGEFQTADLAAANRLVQYLDGLRLYARLSIWRADKRVSLLACD